MDTNLDTFLIAGYTAIDTFYRREIHPHLPPLRGPCPRMRDSEVLTLVVIGQWRGSSEPAPLRLDDGHLRSRFPV